MIANSNITSSKAQRISFGKIKLPSGFPDLLEIQLKSFQEFFQLETTPENRTNEGLYKVFQENFPITDARNIFVLEFLDYFVDPPRYTIEECMQRGLTYSVPLKAKLRLSCNDEEHIDFETVVQDVFLGNIPYMTPKGTFVINGAERCRSLVPCALRNWESGGLLCTSLATLMLPFHPRCSCSSSSSAQRLWCNRNVSVVDFYPRKLLTKCCPGHVGVKGNDRADNCTGKQSNLHKWLASRKI